MKKRNIFLVIILMLLCISSGIYIGLLMLSEKEVVDKNNNQNVNEQVENNDSELNNDDQVDNEYNKELLTISEFFEKKCDPFANDNCDWVNDKTLALNLLSKYNHGHGKLSFLMYEITEDYKNDIASSNLNGKKALCQDYFDLKESNCYENDEIKIISYDELLKKKKELFGKNSTLERKNFLTTPIGKFSYFSNIDSFVFNGYEPKDGWSADSSGIIEIVKSKDNMFIAVYEIVSGLYYHGANVYGYTFKKENNNYYL